MSQSRMKVEDLVDMTAMVDIVFFVLIFFMVASMQETFTTIEMPTPEQKNASSSGRLQSKPQDNPEFLTVRIDRDSIIWLDETEIRTEPELRSRLRAARQTGPASKLLVLGNGEAKHGIVVRVLDAGAEAGMLELQLAIDDES
jgi:biopolymer transport protein ExbD